MFLRKGVLKICNKFTGEHLCQNFIETTNKFAGYFQNTFFLGTPLCGCFCFVEYIINELGILTNISTFVLTFVDVMFTSVLANGSSEIFGVLQEKFSLRIVYKKAAVQSVL